MDKRTPVPAVGVVCLRVNERGGDEVLLIRRGRPPKLGEWSLPGGRLEWGESVADAALRELEEETGVQAELCGLIDVVDGLFPAEGAGDDARHYVLIDFAARWLSGEPRAGDDAAAAAFHPLAKLDDLVAWDETRRVIGLAVKRLRG
ncbi:MAG TPA: NUDIX domain-containing protein [Caulobacteraceae bacterium]|jgi:8-oxo-dGTP diphosphatase|nr:NUDIX domain-containing protein [Caulobacteraceae bacterium]